jgi:putative transposase
VHDTDDSDHAAHLVRRTALAESIATLDAKPVLHGDNGSTLKATTVLAMLNWLGVKPSFERSGTGTWLWGARRGLAPGVVC